VFPTPWRVGHRRVGGAWALSALRCPTCGDSAPAERRRSPSICAPRRPRCAPNTYVLRDGKRPGSWDPLSGHYPTRDGRHMFLHTNHAHHRACALHIAGAASDDRAALAAAVTKWDGFAIEEAIAAGNCVGGPSPAAVRNGPPSAWPGRRPACR